MGAARGGRGRPLKVWDAAAECSSSTWWLNFGYRVDDQRLELRSWWRRATANPDPRFGSRAELFDAIAHAASVEAPPHSIGVCRNGRRLWVVRCDEHQAHDAAVLAAKQEAARRRLSAKLAAERDAGHRASIPPLPQPLTTDRRTHARPEPEA